MKIIVLNNTKYKENDVIYNAITENGYISFKAPGALSGKSQVMWLNNPLTIADAEFSDRRYKYPTLKEAKLISSPINGKESLEELTILSVIIEIANKLLPDDDKHLLFKEIEEGLSALKTAPDKLLAILIFLARAIKIAGASPEVDSCVFCGSTHKIAAFSFRDGGFICEDCLDPTLDLPSFTGSQKLLIRYIFKAPNYSCVGSERYSKEDKIEILKHLQDYIDCDLGVFIHSINQLYK